MREYALEKKRIRRRRFRNFIVKVLLLLLVISIVLYSMQHYYHRYKATFAKMLRPSLAHHERRKEKKLPETSKDNRPMIQFEFYTNLPRASISKPRPPKAAQPDQPFVEAEELENDVLKHMQ